MSFFGPKRLECRYCGKEYRSWRESCSVCFRSNAIEVIRKGERKVIWGCRHCGDTYEGSNVPGDNDKCPNCGLLQSKTFDEQKVNKDVR